MKNAFQIINKRNGAKTDTHKRMIIGIQNIPFLFFNICLILCLLGIISIPVIATDIAGNKDGAKEPINVICANYYNNFVHCYFTRNLDVLSLPDEDIFVGIKGTSLTKVDATDRVVNYLLLIDNSGSMERYENDVRTFVDSVIDEEKQKCVFSIATLGEHFQLINTDLKSKKEVNSCLEKLKYNELVSNISGNTMEALSYLSDIQDQTDEIMNLVVITDGESWLSETGDNQEQIQKVADQLRRAITSNRGIILHTVGFGEWDSYTWDAFSIGFGVNKNIGQDGSVSDLGQSISKFVDGLYYTSFPYSSDFSSKDQFFNILLPVGSNFSNYNKPVMIQNLRNPNYITEDPGKDSEKDESDAAQSLNPEGEPVEGRNTEKDGENTPTVGSDEHSDSFVPGEGSADNKSIPENNDPDKNGIERQSSSEGMTAPEDSEIASDSDSDYGAFPSETVVTSTTQTNTDENDSENDVNKPDDENIARLLFLVPIVIILLILIALAYIAGIKKGKKTKKHTSMDSAGISSEFGNSKTTKTDTEYTNLCDDFLNVGSVHGNVQMGTVVGKPKKLRMIPLESNTEETGQNGYLHVINGSLLIGSGKECDIQLTDSSVSSQNTRIYLKNSNVYIEDLNNNNDSNTYVGGMKIFAPNPLRNGDVIMIGKLQYRVFFLNKDN